MSKQLTTVILLFLLGSSVATADGEQPKANVALESVMSLSKRISRSVQSHFSSMEALAKDKELITAITNEDNDKLTELSAAFQARLRGSLKVRLYIRGQEVADSDTTPACSYACIETVHAAYEGKPPAEALLFRSADANITMARGIKNEHGRVIGAIVAHYPYNELKGEIEKLTTGTMFTELRQRVSGPPIVLFNHGDRNIKQGAAQKIIRIPQSKWVIAVWTPGGVAVETYEAPALPWMYIILGIIVLIAGIAVLIIYRIKHPPAVKKKTIKHAEVLSSEAISYDHEHDSPTLIMGGGAEEIDVSKYLKDSDITSVKIKIK